MTTDQAETIALDGLAWLAGYEEEFAGFLAATGIAPADVRRLAHTPEFLAALLDHLLGDDARVMAMAAATGVAPDDVVAARAALPGGEAPNWP